MNTRRVLNEEIVRAYRETGSVWRAGKRLGVSGQSVWERLRALDYPMSSQKWTEDEKEELAHLLEQNCTLSEVSRRLGRPYAGVALKASRMGLTKRPRPREKKIPRGQGWDKRSTMAKIKEFRTSDLSLRRFCRSKGWHIDTFVLAWQKHYPEEWLDYSSRAGVLESKECPYCGAVFYPMTNKQKTCSRKCTNDMRVDNNYFGGRRRNAIGLAERECQLCLETDKILSVHHVLGKENDPENEWLVALCTGCHQLVTLVANRKWTETEDGWERLIQFALLRRMTTLGSGFGGVYSCVDMEYLTHEELEEEAA